MVEHHLKKRTCTHTMVNMHNRKRRRKDEQMAKEKKLGSKQNVCLNVILNLVNVKIFFFWFWFVHTRDTLLILAIQPYTHHVL